MAALLLAAQVNRTRQRPAAEGICGRATAPGLLQLFASRRSRAHLGASQLGSTVGPSRTRAPGIRTALPSRNAPAVPSPGSSAKHVCFTGLVVVLADANPEGLLSLSRWRPGLLGLPIASSERRGAAPREGAGGQI